MGDLQEDAGAVAGARITSGRAAMREVDQDLERLFDHVMRRDLVERRDKAQATGVVLETRVV